MKRLLATSILLSTALAQGAERIHTFAASLFFDPDGNTGTAFVENTPDGTRLFYSFCVQTTAASCLEGDGTIPSGDLTGVLRTSHGSPDKLVLEADTSIPGFTNQLCFAPNELGGCNGGSAPAPGGRVSLTFVKIPNFAEKIVVSDKARREKIITTSTTTTYQFSAVMAGTVLGVPANTKNLVGIMGFETFDTAVTPRAIQRWLETQPLGNRALRRVESVEP